MELILSDWLMKYSRILHINRERWVMLYRNTNTGEKVVYTFEESVTTVEGSTSQPTEVIKLQRENIYYSVMEYFGALNIKRDYLHFVLQNKFIFKCSSSEDRDELIAAIIETNNYAQPAHENENHHKHHDCLHFDTTEIQFMKNITKYDFISIKCENTLQRNTLHSYMTLKFPKEIYNKSFNDSKKKIGELIRQSVDTYIAEPAADPHWHEMKVIEKYKNINSDLAECKSTTSWCSFTMPKSATVQDFESKIEFIHVKLIAGHKRCLPSLSCGHNNDSTADCKDSIDYNPDFHCVSIWHTM